MKQFYLKGGSIRIGVFFIIIDQLIDTVLSRCRCETLEVPELFRAHEISVKLSSLYFQCSNICVTFFPF